VTLIVEPLAFVVRGGRRLLQGGIRRDHFTGNQVGTDAEMLERSLGLSSPELVGRHLDHTQTVCLFSHLGHDISPFGRRKRPDRSLNARLISACSVVLLVYLANPSTSTTALAKASGAS